MALVRGLVALSLVFPSAIFAQGGGGTGGLMEMMPLMLVMFAIVYFLMIRPEQKKQKQRKLMIEEMKKGDKVLTVGGIRGSISSIKNDIVLVKIAENTVVEMNKSAVSTVITNESAKKDGDTKEKK